MSNNSISKNQKNSFTRKNFKEEPPPLEVNFCDFYTKTIIKVQSIWKPLLFTECDKINFSRFCGRSKIICRSVFFVKNGGKMGKN